MSNDVFPSLPGLSWNVRRRPLWSTTVKRSANGREYRNRNWSYPVWEYSLAFDVLRAASALTEMQQLAGFFNNHGGSFDTWLYNDADDNTVTDQVFAVADGTTRAYQLGRTFGGYVEPIFDLNGAPTIKVNGVTKATPADYTISAGVVTFTTPPASTASLTWTGSFYWRCRFKTDDVEFNQFMRQLWETKQLEFTTVKP